MCDVCKNKKVVEKLLDKFQFSQYKNEALRYVDIKNYQHQVLNMYLISTNDSYLSKPK